MKRLFLLINTIKFLKLQQIIYRFKNFFFKPKITDIYQSFNKIERSNSWKRILLFDEKINQNYESFFLNYHIKLDLPNDWNNKDYPKLWLYNLHYFEDLLSHNAKEKSDLHIELLKKWKDDNPIGYGVGWEPYPSSLRIVNILKAWLGGLDLDNELLESIFLQASYLSSNLEKHILGNHYFSNLKALLFAGIIFKNKNWIDLSSRQLKKQISEQVLEDGSNFELSPMYHSLMLIDMLDLKNLFLSYSHNNLKDINQLLDKNIPKMIRFMNAMSHPDGGVSHFNDSVEGIAPSKDKIESYASRLGYEIDKIEETKSQIIDNSYSGYICAINRDNKLIFDASPIGPGYLTAHSHADTLSMELSIGKERVLVNSGISTYDVGSMRHAQRSTKSHNTVVVDRKNSSEVWSSFRVAKRAQIIDRSSKFVSSDTIFLTARHNGYRTFYNECIHSRSLIFGKNRLVINDQIVGRFKNANAFYYFHPSLDVSLEKDFLNIHGLNFIMKCNLRGVQFTLCESFWYPQFNLKKKNKLLKARFIENDLQLSFDWEYI